MECVNTKQTDPLNNKCYMCNCHILKIKMDLGWGGKKPYTTAKGPAATF